MKHIKCQYKKSEDITWFLCYLEDNQKTINQKCCNDGCEQPPESRSQWM